MPRGWLLCGAQILYLLPLPTLNTPSSPLLLSPPQDNPSNQLEEFPSPGNIYLISLGISSPSREALFQSNKTPQAVRRELTRTLTLLIQGSKA